MNSPLIYNGFGTLRQLIEPALRPIRRILPVFGFLDLSPLVLILGLKFISSVIFEMIVRLMK
jgi:YggT family protein